MSISNKKIETSVIDVGNVQVLVEDIHKTRETVLLDLKGRPSLSISEIRYLRDKFVNKELFTKVLENAENSIFLKGILTIVEEIFQNGKALTIKQVAFFALYYRNQLGSKDSFNRIIKNTEGLFENWFNIYVRYNLLIQLELFYTEAITNLIDLHKADIYQEDIELEKKSTIRFIEKTFLKDFKSFLFNDWEKALSINPEFSEIINTKRKTIIFNE
ncbi:MAG: hypothetical protein KFW07_02560 [Mycoplasmataceae bacterium]|nr:hypothetical protein [Mycoplasmataceae bacterium]